MLVPWKKNYDKSRQHIKKQRHFLPTKVCMFNTMDFLGFMYGCESWTIKKAEHQRIDAFELWCWRRLLRVAWRARRSNQSILKEINPDYSLEGTLLLGKIEGGRRRGWQRVRLLDGITDSMDVSVSKLWEWWWTGRPGVLQSMGSQRIGHTWATKQQQPYKVTVTLYRTQTSFLFFQ